jgi:hypothetical protein
MVLVFSSASSSSLINTPSAARFSYDGTTLTLNLNAPGLAAPENLTACPTCILYTVKKQDITPYSKFHNLAFNGTVFPANELVNVEFLGDSDQVLINNNRY